MLTGSSDPSRYGERFVREIAREIFAQVTAQGGHFCLHAADWGMVKEALDNIKKDLGEMRCDVQVMRDDVARIKGERRIAEKAWVLAFGLIGAIIGAVVSKF